MKSIAFTEFRKRASRLFSEVERGEVLLVLRHGKPIAEVRPMPAAGSHSPSWKRSGLRLVTPGAGLAAAILEDRRRADVP